MPSNGVEEPVDLGALGAVHDPQVSLRAGRFLGVLDRGGMLGRSELLDPATEPFGVKVAGQLKNELRPLAGL